MSIYLGIDLSTQSCSGLAIDTEKDEIVFDRCFQFDRDFPEFKTKDGVLRGNAGEVFSPSLMWAVALERLMKTLSESGLDLSRIEAVSASAQQHAAVYLNESGLRTLCMLQPNQSLEEQLSSGFTRKFSPVWMDSSTGEECAELTRLFSENHLARITGSPATLRFTGPQIRRFFKLQPEAYRQTARINLVSGFICSLLAGIDAPVDTADASGMNLLNLQDKFWDDAIVKATADHLDHRLPKVVPSDSLAGFLSDFWVRRYGFSTNTRVVVSSGDNPCTLPALGLTEPGQTAISLGTSDTCFALSNKSLPIGNCFVSPTEGYMNLICFRNGSLARERIREHCGCDWDGFEKLVLSEDTGNSGRLMLPWFEEEITPSGTRAQVYRFGLTEREDSANARAVIEGQMMAMRRHTSQLGKPDRIHVTGGASRSNVILSVMADVFGAPVRRLATSSGAGLGAALRAWNAAEKADWNDICRRFVKFDDTPFDPDPIRHEKYRDLAEIHQACEDFVLREGKDPESDRLAFARRWK